MKTAAEIVTMLTNAKTPGQKAAATRALNKYIPQRAKERGCTETQVRAGIDASVTRRKNVARQ